MNTHDTIRPLLFAALAGVAALSAFSGCRGDREDKPPRQFFPDLDDQLKWKPQTKSEFFADGRTMRRPVEGTVAFSRINFDPGMLSMNAPAEDRPDWSIRALTERDDFLRADGPYYSGTNSEGAYVEKIPHAVDRKLIARGQERFNIYCAVCHGQIGDGKGLAGQQWSYPLPNFHDDKYKKPDPKDAKAEQWKDGYIFHTLRYGVPETAPDKVGQYKMPPYGYSVNEADGWAIVAYIRALQLSQEGTAADVPAGQIPDIEKTRQPAAPTAPAAPQAPATPAPAANTTKPGGKP